MALLYRSGSRELGTWMMMGWIDSGLVSGSLKVTFCANRPWITDGRRHLPAAIRNIFFFSIPVGPAARDHKAQPVFSIFQDIFWNSEPLRRPESNIAESIIDIQLRHLHLRIHANAGMKYHTPDARTAVMWTGRALRHKQVKENRRKRFLPVHLDRQFFEASVRISARGDVQGLPPADCGEEPDSSGSNQASRMLLRPAR